MNTHRNTRHGARAQRGISLIVSLVLLVVVTLLALGSMRGVVLQTRMSGATQNRVLSFQAAEAALRDAERRAAAASESDFPAANCANGLCSMPDFSVTPRWRDDAFAGWRTSTVAVPTGATTPETIVENMGEAPLWAGCQNEVPRQPNCITHRYLATARSGGAVMVQSQYAAP